MTATVFWERTPPPSTTTMYSPLAPGRVSVQWDGRGADGDPVPSGLYIVVVEGGGVRSQKTVAVIR